MDEVQGADAARAGGDRRPAAQGGEGRDRGVQGSRDPRAHDHRRPRHDRERDRGPARHRRHRALGHRLRGPERRGARRAGRGHRRRRPRGARGQGAARRDAQEEGPRRRDDRRRRQRRSGAQALRHRGRDGHHRHRGDEGSRGHDPHRRQLRHDRRRGRGRPGDLRQPDEVRPLPDDHAGRLHPPLPGCGHLQRRERHPADAAADPLGQLRDRRPARDRARLRRCCSGTDAPSAEGCERARHRPAVGDPARARRVC